MSEVGGTTHHWNDHPVRLDFFTKPGPVSLVRHFQETGIPFHAIDIETGSKRDPFGYGHAAIFAEGLHEGFGKSGELWHRFTEFSGQWSVVGGQIGRRTLFTTSPPCIFSNASCQSVTSQTPPMIGFTSN